MTRDALNLAKTRAVIREVLKRVHTGPYDGPTHQILQDAPYIGTKYEKKFYDKKGKLLPEFDE